MIKLTIFRGMIIEIHKEILCIRKKDESSKFLQTRRIDFLIVMQFVFSLSTHLLLNIATVDTLNKCILLRQITFHSHSIDLELRKSVAQRVSTHELFTMSPNILVNQDFSNDVVQITMMIERTSNK
jgi:hypothetical protein